MPAIGTTLLFSPKRDGIYARQLNVCMNFLTWAVLRHIRIKPSLVGLSGVLTGWGCDMPPKGPG
ncbi:Uncharacterised protein [Serratia fonticola]|uniref:Uncharacterized protein n=1 Tax=Serratia fonticola TaxID=47917 RepID=A0A4U9VW25_SERFO|nr:Uncharacterised protein [Serratia fonticola]